MKKILVPTDFSEYAFYAGDLAVSLAKKTGAEVHFYTRVHVHPQWDELSEESRMNFPESYARIYDAKENFGKLVENYKDTGLKLVTSYSYGDISSNVCNYSEENDIDLIVMGSHGSKGLKELMIGSNTQKVVRHAKCPVLVVKQPVVGVEFRNIIFASDFRKAALAPFEKFVAFAKLFDAHIHLLTVDVPTSFWVPAAFSRGDAGKFRQLAKPLKCTIHQQVDIGVEEGITSFARETEAELVVVAHFGENALLRILTGSVSEALVNHLEIPVFVLPA